MQPLIMPDLSRSPCVCVTLFLQQTLPYPIKNAIISDLPAVLLHELRLSKV